MSLKRFRVRAMSKDYGDAGPDLLRPRDNAKGQLADNMGTAKAGWFYRVNPPGDSTKWSDWRGPFGRGDLLKRVDQWQGTAGDKAKLQVGRNSGGSPQAKSEVLVAMVREVPLANVNAGARMVADLFRAQFGGNIGGFSCREYNGVPGSGWSDHAWGDAVDLTIPGAKSPGPNDRATDWCVRMGQAGCMGGAAQFIGSNGGKVVCYYAPAYKPNAGGPISHLTHVHCSFRQHYGANPRC